MEEKVDRLVELVQKLIKEQVHPVTCPRKPKCTCGWAEIKRILRELGKETERGQ